MSKKSQVVTAVVSQAFIEVIDGRGTVDLGLCLCGQRVLANAEDGSVMHQLPT